MGVPKGVVAIDLVVGSRTQGRWTVVDAEGEVDVFTAPKLREQLVELIDAGSSHLLVNLAGVSFMDSTGLGTLVGSLKRIKERDGTMALCGVNRSVLRVLSITGLDKVFPIYETLDQAVAS